ncbi:unnamed protein product [Penicillium nalgiovense]|nr:unnamed protein product [Penicillium nalgiovense]
MNPNDPPIIDFAPFYANDSTKEDLIHQIRRACEQFGFFQLINHAIPTELQTAVLQHSSEFFNLPLETKEKYNQATGGFNRGYERLRSQNFEKRTKGDLKEGFYLGKDLPLDDAYVVQRRFGQGPNKYPSEVPDPRGFRRVMDEYHDAMIELAVAIMQVIARTLGLNEDFFWRLLRSSGTKAGLGIGAHTDFGAITMLLQDDTGGLQVWNNLLSEWVDVTPVPGAYVVNLGNMMMRWTNNRYLSNLHRVINTSGKERYSIPFFFSGNPNHTIRCLPGCEDEESARYPPITVHEWMAGRYADTYGTSDGKAIGGMRQEPGL